MLWRYANMLVKISSSSSSSSKTLTEFQIALISFIGLLSICAINAKTNDIPEELVVLF
jgi:hypothetical protein